MRHLLYRHHSTVWPLHCRRSAVSYAYTDTNSASSAVHYWEPCALYGMCVLSEICLQSSLGDAQRYGIECTLNKRWFPAIFFTRRVHNTRRRPEIRFALRRSIAIPKHHGPRRLLFGPEDVCGHTNVTAHIDIVQGDNMLARSFGRSRFM